MDKKLSFSAYAAIGFMLFALYFGAGNLIFPALLGQNAGTNFLPAVIGFLITGVGLPLVGLLAIGFSGSNSLDDLAGRVHPIYGTTFTALLYLTIGPFFAAPRTGTVAYEVGIAPFLSNPQDGNSLLIFTIIFFAIALGFSLFPANIVDNVGKMLSPALVLLLLFLLVTVLVKPMGSIQAPINGYEQGAFIKGFLEGYNTMDALASLVFGIIVIQAIRSLGVKSTKAVFMATAKSGIVATILLAIIYMGIAYLGATGTTVLGEFDNGGPILSGVAKHYFGTIGLTLLAIVILLACLTTAIGLITANAEYFNKLFPSLNYKVLVVFFALLTFTIANFGLENIIKYSIPVLMFLYPLAIVIMILAFIAPLFNNARIVYVGTIFVTFIISFFDGLNALAGTLEMDFAWMNTVIVFFLKILPLQADGLGWLLPALITLIITGILAKVLKLKPVA